MNEPQPPPDCVHHWLIGTPHVEWDGPELVEVTNQTCKKCTEFKRNVVVLPREVVSDR